MSHWSDYLVRGFPEGETSAVTITITPGTDSAAVVLLASRLRGLVDALRVPDTAESDPLDVEDVDELVRLLDHLHRVRMVLEGQEERVLTVAHRRGASLRTLAAVLEVRSPETVRYRLAAIERAAERGLTAAAVARDLDDALAAADTTTD